jgi:hypothetical protein
MKRLDFSTKPIHTHLFEAPTPLTNFLHMRCMDFTSEVVGDQNHDLAHTWLVKGLLTTSPNCFNL